MSDLFESILQEAITAGTIAADSVDLSKFIDGSGYVCVKLGKPSKSDFAKWYANREKTNKSTVKMDGVRFVVRDLDPYGGIIKKKKFAEVFAMILNRYKIPASPYTYLT